ncbi:MAG: ABC transporter permease [Phycisphaerae bacterium]
MKALLWKDFRMNRGMMMVGVVIGAAVYAMGVVVEVVAHWPERPTRVDWAGMLNSYGVVTMFMTYVAAAMFAGNAVAVERNERSAHFLAYLPAEKWRILMSKLVVAVGVVCVVWVWALISMYVVAPSLDQLQAPDGPQVRELVGWCVLAFGVAWGCSAEMEKPVAPIVAGLVSPAVVGLVVECVVAFGGMPRSRGVGVAVNCAVGVVAFGVGTWGYLRRAEP